MLFARIAQVARRRWYVVAVGVALTVIAAALVPTVKPPQYSVSATALILPPKISADGEATNPYLQLGGLTTAVDVLARSLNDPRVRDEIITAGEGSDYVAQRDFLTAAPLLVVTVQSTSADRAREIRADVLAAVPEVLSELQATIGVPATSRLTMETIVSDGSASLAYKTILRTIILVLVSGFAFSLLVAGAVDGWVLRRRNRDAYRAADASVSASEGEGSAEE